MQQHSKKHTYEKKLGPLSTRQSQKIINTNFWGFFSDRHTEHSQFVPTGLIWWNSAEQGRNFQYLKNIEFDETDLYDSKQSSKKMEVLLNSYHCNTKPHQGHSSISDYYCQVSLPFSDTEK